MGLKSIRDIRRQAGIRQAELAERVGCSQAMISQMENGCRSALPDTLEAIARELQCSVEDITGEPSFYIQFMRNCKKLTQKQLIALNELVLQFTNKI